MLQNYKSIICLDFEFRHDDGEALPNEVVCCVAKDLVTGKTWRFSGGQCRTRGGQQAAGAGSGCVQRLWLRSAGGRSTGIGEDEFALPNFAWGRWFLRWRKGWGRGEVTRVVGAFPAFDNR